MSDLMKDESVCEFADFYGSYKVRRGDGVAILVQMEPVDDYYARLLAEAVNRKVTVAGVEYHEVLPFYEEPFFPARHDNTENYQKYDLELRKHERVVLEKKMVRDGKTISPMREGAL